jgi:hypothetical protein
MNSRPSLINLKLHGIIWRDSSYLVHEAATRPVLAPMQSCMHDSRHCHGAGGREAPTHSVLRAADSDLLHWASTVGRMHAPQWAVRGKRTSVQQRWCLPVSSQQAANLSLDQSILRRPRAWAWHTHWHRLSHTLAAWTDRSKCTALAIQFTQESLSVSSPPCSHTCNLCIQLLAQERLDQTSQVELWRHDIMRIVVSLLTKKVLTV